MQTSIVCPVGTAISIINATFGFGNDFFASDCAPISPASCQIAVVSSVAAACDGKRSCFIDVEDDVDDIPCFGVEMHLKVEYDCGMS